MKIIITKFFKKIFIKTVLDLSIKELLDKINVESKNFIDLNQPYFKIKIKSKTKSYRLLVAYERNKAIILFINIFDKKNKKYGENINWKLHKTKIIEWRDKNIESIKSGNYNSYFIK